MQPTPIIILVRPQIGENIGAAARAMWNFGLDRMRIVDPRDGWPNQKAVAMASGAGRLLDEAPIVPDVPTALEGLDVVYATTARPRGLTKRVVTPEQAMAETKGHLLAGRRVGVFFGPERAGLENHEIARANAIISVPVNPAVTSLNLAQCVLLVGYEWQRQVTETVAEQMELAGADWASAVEIEKLAQHYEDRLDVAGYFFPETKAPGMKIVLRNMWSRLPLTRADVQIFHGLLRQMVRWKDRD
ncbi:MAG: RNA methyltransferase [Pseudomonadota bacterium]